MKVGTDAVLLGAWMQASHDRIRMLDIGCGTGIISLMAAQRNPEADIQSIDIDRISVEEADDNFRQSPWPARITAKEISFQKLSEDPSLQGKYAHLFSNPPYFENSLKSDDSRKMTARHNDSLPFEEIINGFKRLTGEDGLLSIILPSSEFEIFLHRAKRDGLYAERICYVKTSPKKPHKRVLAEFRRKKSQLVEDELTIQENGQYTETYKSLTRDFHPFL